MLLMLLAGCFEHTRETLDVAVNVGKQTVVLDAAYLDVTPDVENLPAAPLDDVLAKLKDERDGTLKRFEGAQNLSVRYVLHEAVVDLVIHAEGPFSYWAEDHGEPLRVGIVLTAAEWSKHGAGKALFGMWFEESAKQHLTLTGTGPFEVARLATTEPAEAVDLVMLRRGKGMFHAENQLVEDDGTPAKGSGWVGAMPALPEAMKAAGLL